MGIRYLLVSRAAGRTLSAASLRRILDMGEGIPLYLRELAMLARDEELPLPPTLNTLFASRTDTLPLRLRQILPGAERDARTASRRRAWWKE